MKMKSKYIPLFGSWIIAGTSSFLLLKGGGYTIHCVEGPSMRPNLNPIDSYFKDYVLVKRTDTLNKSNIAINSIICVQHPKQKNGYLIKRLIANENDTVVITPNNSSDSQTSTKIIPKGHCWIQSDAGPGFLDSSSYLGPISYDTVVGKAVYIIWPLIRIRKL